MSTTTISHTRRSNFRNLNLKNNKTADENYSLWKKVLAVTKKRNATIAEISEVIDQDDSLRQEILFLAKCAKHYNGRPVTSVEQAIMLIGVDRICSAVEERRKLKLSA